MKIEALPDADSVARAGAVFTAAQARAAVAARGRFTMAVSGERTPWTMLRALADEPISNVTTADVALTAMYQRRRRMTLTYPLLNRSRRILWLVTGHEKGRHVDAAL